MNSQTSKGNKIFLLLLSILLAFVIWYLISGNSANLIAEDLDNIPIVLRNEDTLGEKNLVLDNKNVNYFVNLELRGSESNLEAINSEDVYAEVDLSNVEVAGPQELEIVVNGLNNSVIVERKIPNLLQLDFSTLSDSVWTPTIQTEGIPGDGLTTISSYTDTQVTLEGALSDLERVKEVSGVVSVNGITEDSVRYVNVYAYDAEGQVLTDVTCSPSVVTAYISLGISKEVPLNPPVVDGTISSNSRITSIELSPDKVMIAGKSELLDTITSLNTTNITAPNVNQSVSFNTQTEIQFPEGVISLDNVTTARVDVVIDQLITKDYTISSLKPIQLAEGLSIASIRPASITITVRGTSSQLKDIDASKLEGTIDLTGLGPGNYQLPVSVSISNVEILSVEPVEVEIVKSN